MASITAAAGGGNWTTGGTWVGGIAPTAADDAFLDATSGNVTVDSGAVCRSCDCNGYTGTLTHTAGVTLTIGDGTAGAGNRALRLASGMTYTLGSSSTSAISFISTSATVQTVTTAGKTLGNVTFNGVAGSWQLADANTVGSAATVTLTNGTLDTNSQTCSWGIFSSANANTRVLTLGASQITLTGSNVNVWNVNNGSGADATALTLNAGTSTITVTGATTGTSTNTFSGGGKTYNNVVINGPIRCTVNYTSTFANLTINGIASTSCRYTIALNQTVTGAFTCAGLSSTQRPLILGAGTSSESTRRTITVGSVSFSNCDFQSIGISGVTATGTRLGDATNNSGITFDSARTVYWSNTLGGNWSDNANWSLTSGGAGGADFPLPQDTVVFDANSLTTTGQEVTADIVSLGLNVSFASCATSPTLRLRSSGIIGNSLFGSLTLKSGMTIAGSDEFHLRSASASTITSAGVSFSQNFIIIAPFGSYSLVDALSLPTNRTFQVQFGTFDANGQNVTTGLFSGSGTNTRTLTMGSGTWTLTGVGTVFNTGTVTNLTFSGASATIYVTDTSSALKTLALGTGVTPIGTLRIAPGGTGPIAFSNGGTRVFTTLEVTGPKTIVWQSARTYQATNFTINSSIDRPVTFLSDVPGTQYTLSVASGTVGSRFMSIFDCIGSGGATFVARESYGNNTTGWTIVPPRINQAMATLSYALNFPNNAAVDVVSASNSGVAANGSWSLCAWIDITGYTGTRQDIHGVNFTPTNSAISVGSTGLYVLNDPVGLISTTVRAPIGRMVPIVTTWDAVNARGSMYFDGYLIYTRTGTATAFTDGKIVTGRFAYSAAQPAWAAVSRRRIFARALSAAEVMAWSRNNVEPDDTGLRAEYNLLAGSGSTDVDTSGNGNNGTITGATWVTDRVYTARVAAANRVPTSGRNAATNRVQL